MEENKICIAMKTAVMHTILSLQRGFLDSKPKPNSTARQMAL
jgi:hypothetical protein